MQFEHDSTLHGDTMLARFGIAPGQDLSLVSWDEAEVLMDRIYAALQNYAHGSEEYPRILRLLQDCCFHTRTLPNPFYLKNIAFSRRERIGRGGTAIIYQGQWGEVDVAVRELVPAVMFKRQGQALDYKLIRIVHREAITRSQLHHPNILPFLGIHCEDDNSYPLIIMPLFKHGSLQDFLWDLGPSSSLTLSDFSKTLIGITSGVLYLHSRKPPIIHGGLHPGNILIDEAKGPVITGFGSSRIRHEVSRKLSIHSELEGGRPRFLAPEISDLQAVHFCLTRESDVFALAMTFLNTWTAQLPFAELNDRQVTVSLMQGLRPAQPVTKVVLDPNVKSDLWCLIVDMWAHKREARPSTGRVLERLEGIFDYCHLVSSSPYLFRNMTVPSVATHHQEPNTHNPLSHLSYHQLQIDSNAALETAAMLPRFGAVNGSDLSQLSSDEATMLLDRIYDHLRGLDSSSDEYPRTMRLLQDCCFLTCAFPSLFILKDVTFSISNWRRVGGEAILNIGQNAGLDVVIRHVAPVGRLNRPVRREDIQVVLREAIIHSQLLHPNILPFLGIYRERTDSWPLIILPYIERGSLEDMLDPLMSSALMSQRDLIKILVGSAEGLVYLHSRRPPIIHGDLHPVC
ncbi:kinase-like protein [Clavulina sp. PMI_390]|nr:kinase-like protein [Clavulina sp. PMI_390]